MVEKENYEARAAVRAEKRAEKGEQKKEWKEHFGELAEVQLAREKAEQELKKEQKSVESAKIPEKGGEPAEIMKEAKAPETSEALQKQTAQIERKQQEREKKIESLQGVKAVGKERLEKAGDALAVAVSPDKLALLGLKEAKKLAVRGSRWLAKIGLAPAIAFEEAGRDIIGRLEIRLGSMGKVLAEAKVSSLEEMPPAKRPEAYQAILEGAKEVSRKKSEQLQKGVEKLYKKGLFCKLFEKLWTS